MVLVQLRPKRSKIPVTYFLLAISWLELLFLYVQVMGNMCVMITFRSCRGKIFSKMTVFGQCEIKNMCNKVKTSYYICGDLGKLFSVTGNENIINVSDTS